MPLISGSALAALVGAGLLVGVVLYGMRGRSLPRLLGLGAAVLTVAVFIEVIGAATAWSEGPEVAPILAAGRSCASILPDYPERFDLAPNNPRYSCHGVSQSDGSAKALQESVLAASVMRGWRVVAAPTGTGWLELVRRGRPQMRARLVVMSTATGSQVVEDAFLDCRQLWYGPGPTARCGSPVVEPTPKPGEIDFCGIPLDAPLSSDYSGGGTDCEDWYSTRQSPTAVRAFYQTAIAGSGWSVTLAPAGSGVLYLRSANNAAYVVVDQVGGLTQVVAEAGPRSGCPCGPPS